MHDYRHRCATRCATTSAWIPAHSFRTIAARELLCHSQVTLLNTRSWRKKRENTIASCETFEVRVVRCQLAVMCNVPQELMIRGQHDVIAMNEVHKLRSLCTLRNRKHRRADETISGIPATIKSTNLTHLLHALPAALDAMGSGAPFVQNESRN